MQEQIALKLCLSSINDQSAAKKIATTLLELKLVACVNISENFHSIYSWKGEIVEEKEFLMIMKTTAKQTASLKKKLLELHPYEVPEFIQLDVENSAENYFNWVLQSVKK